MALARHWWECSNDTFPNDASGCAASANTVRGRSGSTVGPSGSHYIIGPLQKASGPRKKEKNRCLIFGTRTIGGLIGTRGDLSREEELLRQNSESMSQIGSSESHDDGQSESQFSRRAYPGQPAHGTRRQGARRWFHAGPEHVHSC